MKMTEIAAAEFDLAMTLDSGQVFHWDKIGNGFTGAIGERAFYVEQDRALLKVRCAGTAQPARETRALPEIIRNYFALDHPLPEICASFPDDSVMNAAREFCRGLRVIRQRKWECLATLICSSMKQVAHIRQISRKLRERFGEARKISLQRSLQNTQGGSAARRAMLIDSASPTFVNIELATGRVRPFGGQGTARSTFATLALRKIPGIEAAFLKACVKSSSPAGRRPLCAPLVSRNRCSERRFRILLAWNWTT